MPFKVIFIFRKERYQQFLTKSSAAEQNNSRQLTDYFNPTAKWKSTDPKNVAIGRSIVKMIIDCSLPITLVEKPSFRELISKCGQGSII